MYFLLHEMMHNVVTNTGPDHDLDHALANALNITKGPNETWSDAVSRFFNSKCTQKTP